MKKEMMVMMSMAVLVGCSFKDKTWVRNQAKDYQEVQQLEPLQIPEHFEPLAYDEYYDLRNTHQTDRPEANIFPPGVEE